MRAPLERDDEHRDVGQRRGAGDGGELVAHDGGAADGAPQRGLVEDDLKVQGLVGAVQYFGATGAQGDQALDGAGAVDATR